MSKPATDRLAGVGHPRRRSRGVLLVFALVLSLFAGRLVYLQAIDAGRLSHKALSKRLSRVTIEAPRGEIRDRNGKVLARSVERRDITVDPVAALEFRKNAKTSEPKGIAGEAKELARVLGGDEADIERRMTAAAKRKSRFLYVQKGATPAQWSQLKALELPGVYSTMTQHREYTSGTALSPLLGWVNQAGEAGGGIEQMFDKSLQGTPGVHQIERARDGSEIATGDNLDQDPVAGRDVQLTIDSDLQWYATNELVAQVKATEAESGEVVISDKAGHLLAAVSYPTFDNNDISSATSESLQNRAFTSAYEPGSTQKMVTAGALLQEGIANPLSRYTVPSSLERAGRSFKDAEEHGTEYLTLAGIIAKSSNMGTILAGEKMPKDTLYAYMKKFGLGMPTGIRFPGESAGYVPGVSSWTGDTWYTIMFGQGMSSTPVQQVGEFQTIANGGVRNPLSLVQQVEDSNGSMAQAADDRKPSQVFSADVSKQLIGMMEGVVSKNGSAPKAAVPGYAVAGKTSTAQIYDSKLKRYDGVSAGFVGMAPANDPQYIVSVNIQHPKKGTFGGDVAAPVFSKIMTHVLENRKIPPSKSTTLPYPIEYRTEESTSK